MESHDIELFSVWGLGVQFERRESWLQADADARGVVRLRALCSVRLKYYCIVCTSILDELAFFV